ncbi:MAG: primosomal protein N' [Myxococcota bacterium]|jgi:primosomal protein N' (replication factor Y)|nr:primosomal protein N' [Myxococcota bacterium]
MSKASGQDRRARVLFSEPIPLLDYLIPDELKAHIHVGDAVEVPLGKRLMQGYVAELTSKPLEEKFELKALKQKVEELPQLPKNLIRLLLFAADYYALPHGEMLSAALPAVFRRVQPKYVLSKDAQKQAEEAGLKKHVLDTFQALSEHPKGINLNGLEKKLEVKRPTIAKHLKFLFEQGLIEKVKVHKGPRQIVAYQKVAGADVERLPSKQKKARELFLTMPENETLEAGALVRNSADYKRLKLMEELGLVKRLFVQRRKSVDIQQMITPDDIVLNVDQNKAVDTLRKHVEGKKYGAFLLHGVTGSGKTEVYLKTIEHALGQGRSALVLVPEIALTPQLGQLFKLRFGEQVAIFHSGLTVAERRDEWDRVANGGAQIGLGARSAIFLPFADLGVVVVDEEHETSFKQDETPRYHARDLAVVRGKLENATVILGSATPSLESMCNAQKERYGLLSLPQRATPKPLPKVELIDLRAAQCVGESLFSETLFRAMEKTLARDEQVILFLNRRGFAPYIFCKDCGFHFRCEDCEVSLTWHKRTGNLMCHYCAHQERAPEICRECKGHRLDSMGIGTERIQEDVQALFPGVELVRLDRDTVQKRRLLEEKLDRFRSGQAKILIGTQMVAKGHDFPGVTLVGVLAADVGLNLPDFRAAERTFQLVAQVAGRAGRGIKAGQVLVQTFEPDHYSLEAAKTHDYAAFVAQEMVAREELSYPPFGFLSMVRFEGPNESQVLKEAQIFCDALEAAQAKRTNKVQIMGPVAAPLARLKSQWRYQVLLKSRSRQTLRDLLTTLTLRKLTGIRRIIDMDPISML